MGARLKPISCTIGPTTAPMSEGGHLCVGRQHCESEHRQDPDRQHEDGIVVIEPIPMPSMGSCSRQVWPSATNATAGECGGVAELVVEAHANDICAEIICLVCMSY